MKKMIYLFLTFTICLGLLTGCGLFGGNDDTEQENTTISDEKDSTDDGKTETTNPRDNVADNAEKEFTATGKYCGFIDSNSVEIELSDGSCCTFFVFKDDVRDALTLLKEEDMPEISFTYKAREGQINPEMIAVTVK